MYVKERPLPRQANGSEVLSDSIYPWEGVVRTPFSAVRDVVPSRSATRPERHHEAETFCIVEGTGLMQVDDDVREVAPGDIVYIPPFSTHTLRNTSAAEALTFVSFYWEDMPLALERIRTQGAAHRRQRPRRTLVTATPPTPNGDLHLGHLAGPYLAADVHARYLRMRGVEALYVSGSDEHQSYVPLKAEQTGTTPRAVVDGCTDRMVETLRLAGIEADLFARPSRSAHHVELVQGFFRDLYAAGKLVAKEGPVPYCESCQRVLHEAHVHGSCPHCGAGSDGNACESCGRPNDCVDLVDPRCKRCGATPAVRTARRIFLPLSRYADDLAAFHSRVGMNAHVRALCERMLADGLPDIPVTHVTDWGIPVPVPGFEDQRIYVWFEMAPGYLAEASEVLADRSAEGDWRSLWRDPDAEVVQFFGFDNAWYHAVLFPAALLAWDPGIGLPARFVVNEFYRLEGSKFSTSRGHAVWGADFLREAPADLARFYLAYDRPEAEQTSFTLPEFRDTVNRLLLGEAGWAGWLARLAAKAERELDGTAPEPGTWTGAHASFYARLKEIGDAVAGCYEAETFSMQRAARLLVELVREASSFGRAEDHLAGVASRHGERRTAIALELAAAKTLSMVAAPLMPAFAARLRAGLGEAEPASAPAWEETPSMVPKGSSLAGLAGPYFPARA